MAEAEERRNSFVSWCRDDGYQRAAETLERDWDRMVTFYRFPKEHWKHLRTTNVVESPFAALRLRTNAANAYGSLKDSAGAWRVRDGRKLEVHIGATAASKILFAIRPKALMPWDKAMRTSFECDGSPKSYSRYLKTIRNLTSHIGALCRNNGFQIDDLPRELGRPTSTVLALVNEYIWVTQTRKCELPSSRTLARWAELG